MTPNPLPLVDPADRQARRSTTMIGIAGVAVLALSAFAVAEMATHEGITPAAVMPAMAPVDILSTVPQAADVLPSAPVRDEPVIATHGG